MAIGKRMCVVDKTSLYCYYCYLIADAMHYAYYNLV